MSGKLERHTFSTPHSQPVRYWIRPWTSDWNTCNAITGQHDEYHIPQGLTGWALDIGSHIGACAVALALDNPGLRVIAIEALPENVELLRMNVEENGVADRVTVVQGAATSYGVKVVPIGYGEVADPSGIHEFIGNMAAPPGSRFEDAPGVSLEALRKAYGFDRIVWAKLDCEGCEGPFLSSGLLERIDHIEGELHPIVGHESLRAILEATHDVSLPGFEANPDFGPFVAVRRG